MRKGYNLNLRGENDVSEKRFSTDDIVATVWGIFDAGGELIDVRLTPETMLPNRPRCVRLVQISWKED